MSALKMSELLGRTGTYAPGGGARGAATFLVKILDVEAVFGRRNVLIAPVAGHGEQWVARESVKLAEDTPVTAVLR